MCTDAFGDLVDLRHERRARSGDPQLRPCTDDDRGARSSRPTDCRALGAFRLLRVTDTADLANRLSTLLATHVSASVTDEAIRLLPELFGSTESEGVAGGRRDCRRRSDPRCFSRCTGRRLAGVAAQRLSNASTTWLAGGDLLRRPDRHAYPVL